MSWTIGGGGGIPSETSEFLKHWTYDEETRRGKFDGYSVQSNSVIPNFDYSDYIY